MLAAVSVVFRSKRAGCLVCRWMWLASRLTVRRRLNRSSPSRPAPGPILALVLRIANYNIWNSNRNWSNRLAAIVEELASLDADVVALQEVPVEAAPGMPIDGYFRERMTYPHVLHLPYPGPADKRESPEGLGFLSKLPIEDVHVNWANGRPTDNSWAGRFVVTWE